MNVRILFLLFLSTLLLVGCVNTTSNPPVATAQASAAGTTTVSATSQAQASVDAPADFKTYSGDAFEIQYPSEWTVREEPQYVLFTAPTSGENDALQENLNVVLAPTDLSLEEFVQTALGDSFESGNAQLADSRETTLSGYPARQVSYTEKTGDTTLAYLQVISVQNGQAVIVTFASTPETIEAYLAQAVQMFTSFKLKTQSTPLQAVESSMEPQIVRKWRVYSESIFYDEGGSNFLETPATTLLDIRTDQTWSFGSSSGTWSIQPIENADWQKWGVNAYGPKRKLVLNGWNGGTNDGPIEQSGDRVDFMWVIYRAEPPTVQSAGQIQMKFGWTNQQG